MHEKDQQYSSPTKWIWDGVYSWKQREGDIQSQWIAPWNFHKHTTYLPLAFPWLLATWPYLPQNPILLGGNKEAILSVHRDKVSDLIEEFNQLYNMNYYEFHLLNLTNITLLPMKADANHMEILCKLA